MSHPARFSIEIIKAFEDILTPLYPDWMGRPYLHDPWGGTGERLADMAAELGFAYSGTEIEKSFIVAKGIRHGSSLDPDTYPDRWRRRSELTGKMSTAGHPYVIVTSVVYPNGVADHHKASDASKRNTYRAEIGRLEGADRELHPDNMARYGYRGTKRGGTSAKRKAFWDLAERTVELWSTAEMVIVNAKDFPHSNGKIEPFVADMRDLVERHGWVLDRDIEVATPGLREGENHEKRVDHEHVMVFVHG